MFPTYSNSIFVRFYSVSSLPRDDPVHWPSCEQPGFTCLALWHIQQLGHHWPHRCLVTTMRTTKLGMSPFKFIWLSMSLNDNFYTRWFNPMVISVACLIFFHKHLVYVIEFVHISIFTITGTCYFTMNNYKAQQTWNTLEIIGISLW